MRQKPHDRKAAILQAALHAARIHGYSHVSREQIAGYAECAPALVSRYYGTMTCLRRAIMGAAIAHRDLAVLAQGLAAKDNRAMGADEELRRAAVESLL